MTASSYHCKRSNSPTPTWSYRSSSLISSMK